MYSLLTSNISDCCTVSLEVRASSPGMLPSRTKIPSPRLARLVISDSAIRTLVVQGTLTALIAVLPLQFIAYELAIAKGINPDTPRNLAKAVTTD